MDTNLFYKLNFTLLLLILISIKKPVFSINKFKIVESDSVYFQSIDKLEYSPNNELFVVSQKSESNRINIFNKDGTLYKSYLIDDSYTDKYIDLLKNKDVKENIQSTDYLKTIRGHPKVLYKNTVSKSLFLNDSIIYTISGLNYYVDGDKVLGVDGLILKVRTVLIKINIFSDKEEIIPLAFIHNKLYPQSDYLEFFNNYLFFRLFPIGVHESRPNSPKYVLARFNLDSNNWQPILELPKEYEASKVNLFLDYKYRITSYKNKTYFIAPYLNYVFNLDGDTIQLSGLHNAIQYSLSKFGSDTLIKKNYKMLDSLSHFIGGIFFKNDFLYVLLRKTSKRDGKKYLNKYSLNGELLDSKLVNKERKLETVFYSENKHKLIKVYLENDEWYVEEVDVN